MKKGRVFIIHLMDRFYRCEKRLFSLKRKKHLFDYVCAVFEDEAIDCYRADNKDIGFFETFILGSDKTKTISSETDKTMQVLKKSELMEKLSGFVPSRTRQMNEREEVAKENIQMKKEEVIRLLKQRGEIIKYLGRRIVVRDEDLYQRLERLYEGLNQEINPFRPEAGSSNE